MFHLLFGGGILLGLLWLVIGIAAFVFWIVALIDVIRRRFDSDVTKIIWVLVVFFLHVLGAIIYWVVGRPSGTLAGSAY